MIKSKAKREHLLDCPKNVNIGIVIVSTSRTNEIRNNLPCTDENIPFMNEILSRPMHLDVDTRYIVSFSTIISDEENEINQIIQKYTVDSSGIHVLIFWGSDDIKVAVKDHIAGLPSLEGKVAVDIPAGDNTYDRPIGL